MEHQATIHYSSPVKIRNNVFVETFLFFWWVISKILKKVFGLIAIILRFVGALFQSRSSGPFSWFTEFAKSAVGELKDKLPLVHGFSVVILVALLVLIIGVFFTHLPHIVVVVLAGLSVFFPKKKVLFYVLALIACFSFLQEILI